ncbi:ABC transporter substrate-binding protein [Phytohabitans suffuscus]|uniref:Sugar ABC transporter substrate-binding protein n=1 Tax=Phytohabitans suffuscus TaxID=624315 RepID=A0A6F8YZ20_9ACTN|nr:extracellular solute-binding protein [Phytohabitans suffuscus]BCB91332.1 sugar ABC transporter substrate-binding protein [Phytohabitans suffuscus]
MLRSPLDQPSQRPRLRRVLAAATAAAVSLALAACGGDSGSDEPGGPVELTVWVAREQYMPTQQWTDSFKAKYPNITVKAELQADDALFAQMQRMLQARQPLPDLVQVDSFWAAPMFDTGIAQDMTPLVDRWKQEAPDLFAKQADAMFYRYQDKVVGLGTTGTADVLYYRADWLKEAGFTPPLKSWDEVLQALRAIKAKHPGIVPWSMIGTRGEGVNYLITQMMASGVQFDAATPRLTSDAGKYVINFYQTMVREGLTTKEALAWGENESRGAWIGGRAAMTLDGVRSSNDLGDAIQEGLKITQPDGWSMMVPPLATTAGGAEVGKHVTATRTFHVTSTTKHAYEASLVLRHMVETDQALDAAKSGAIYLQKDVLQAPEFRQAYKYLSDAEVDAFANGAAFPSSSKFFAVVEVLERMVQDILNNPGTPTDELAQKWQKELDALGDK